MASVATGVASDRQPIGQWKGESVRWCLTKKEIGAGSEAFRQEKEQFHVSQSPRICGGADLWSSEQWFRVSEK